MGEILNFMACIDARKALRTALLATSWLSMQSFKGFAHIRDKRQVWSNATVFDAILGDLPRLQKMHMRGKSDKRQCLCKVEEFLFSVACRLRVKISLHNG